MAKKTFFKNYKDEIHFGVNAHEGLEPCTKSEVEELLQERKGKKFWRCTVCNDLHIGNPPQEECPTCHVPEAYVEIIEREFKKLAGLKN